MADHLTIDDVAAATGLPSSTIRYYQQQQVIDPPRHEGRRAFYGSRHIDQVIRVTELSQRGFSLAAIKEMRRAEADGRTLDDLLQSATLAESQQMTEMSLEELAAQVLEEDEPASPEQFTTSVELGIVELTDAGTVRVHTEALALGREIRALGIARDEVLARHVEVRRLTDQIAETLMDMYDTRERASDNDASAQYERFVVLARRTVEFAFLRSLEDLRRRRIAGEAP